MPSTNCLFESPHFRNWKAYTDPFPTNDRYVTFGWLFMISAALQRRVWLDSEHRPTYPNQYMLFVAPPGVGKSMITDGVRHIFELQTEESLTGKNATAVTKKATRLLYPISADSTSFESFVEFTAKSCKPFRRFKPDKSPDEPYYHCSPTFILDEAASIFDKEAQKMATFLLSGWSCSRSYSRVTIGRGEDSIFNLCVNLIGGIQPGKLADLSKQAIIDNGFSRRCIMVYADSNRFRRVFIDHTEEQSAAFTAILPHIRSLSKLYGQVEITPRAKAWMREVFEEGQATVINNNPCLEYYYPTKHQHVKKLAMAIHFSSSTSMVIDLPAFETAKALLDEIEPDMHYAYVGAKDARGEIIKRIKSVLRAVRVTNPEGYTKDELYPDLVELVDYEDLGSVLLDLVKANVLVQTTSGSYMLKS